MLEGLINSKNKENILLYLTGRNEGYPREIAKYYNTDISPVQNQLEKLENGGILYSKLVGRTRLYSFNPRYPFLKELTALTKKVMEFLPDKEKQELLFGRKRPRRKGKPL